MFDSVGWAEMLVLVVAALFILGPERLPQAASWLGRNTRKLREFVTGAQHQLRDEIGPEFDELRQPLKELKGLRNTGPTRAVTRHLFDDDDDPLGLRDDAGSSAHSNSSYRDAQPNGYQTVPTRQSGERNPGNTPPDRLGRHLKTVLPWCQRDDA